MRRILLVAVAAVGLTGCFSTGRYDQIPKPDQDRFARCVQPMYVAMCGADHDGIYASNCTRMRAAQYADLDSERERKTWLISNGCPPPMVEPERFVGQQANR